MKSRNFFTNLFNTSGFYIWFIFLCSVVIGFYSVQTALIVALFAVVSLILSIITSRFHQKDIKKFLNFLTDNMNTDIKGILGGTLIPLVIIRHDGVVLWSNEGFCNIVKTHNTKKIHISELIPNFELCECINTDAGSFYSIEHNSRKYLIDISSNQTDDDKYYALHFKDCTEYEMLKTRYNDERFVCAVILIDNYDVVMIDVSNSDNPKVSAAIEECLSLWAQSVNGILKKYEKDRYMFYFSNKGLEEFASKRFDILERIRDISIGNRLSPTLSIGVGSGGDNMLQNEAYAYNALDMALGRGGDQAIVKCDEKYDFYGGKAQETEKRTKVKARVVAEAIKQLLTENDDIIIMGHKNADCDSFGAAMGLYRAIKSMGKSCKIVLENYNPTVRKMIKNFTEPE